MNTVSLGNGVYLHHTRTDCFKTTVFSVRFLYPVREGRSAADTILPRILQHGCRACPTERDLQIRLDELYGSDLAHSYERIGDMRVMSFTVDFLSERYLPSGTGLRDQVIGLLLSILFEPLADAEKGFSAEYTEREKTAHLDRLLSIKNQKGAYALARCREQMRDPNRYDVPSAGTEAETLAVTPRLLYEQYLYMLDRAEIHFSYVGPDSDAEIAALIRERAPRPSPDLRPFVFRRPRAARVRRVSEQTSGAQSILVLGYRTGVCIGEEDAVLYPLFTEILSDSPMAKLFCSVREKKNLCYSIRAGASLSPGTLMISAGIDRERSGEAERAIRAEISKCCRGEITDEELACAKESVTSAYYSIGDSPTDIDAYFSRAKLLHKDIPIETRLDRILSATAEDIARLASKLSLDTVYLLAAGEGGDGK